MMFIQTSVFRQCDHTYVFCFQVFQGNTDQDTIVRNNFLMPLNAQVIQFWPQSWQVHISMRVEVYGAAQTCK